MDDTLPHGLTRVWIESRPGEVGGKQVWSDRRWCVVHTVWWSYQDADGHERTGSISCSEKLPLAHRLMAAIKAGVAVRPNSNGNLHPVVLGRVLSAELRRLGF
jgi:hypothetical protein